MSPPDSLRDTPVRRRQPSLSIVTPTPQRVPSASPAQQGTPGARSVPIGAAGTTLRAIPRAPMQVALAPASQQSTPSRAAPGTSSHSLPSQLPRAAGDDRDPYAPLPRKLSWFLF